MKTLLVITPPRSHDIPTAPLQTNPLETQDIGPPIL